MFYPRPADIIGHLMVSKNDSNTHTPTIPKDDINLMHTHTKRWYKKMAKYSLSHITPLRLKDDIPKDDIILMHTHSKDDIKKWPNTHSPPYYIFQIKRCHQNQIHFIHTNSSRDLFLSGDGQYQHMGLSTI